MPVPDYQSFMRPLLELLAETGELRIREAAERLADRFGLSEEDRQALLPSGRQTLLQNRVHWAATYLVKAGLLERPRRGVVRLTDRGRAVLARPPERVDIAFLEQFPEFREFRRTTPPRRREDDVAGGLGPVDDEAAEPPNERLAAIHRELVAGVASDLLDRLRIAEPAFFERAVLDLLEAMGYGRGTVTGRSGDGGIDGIVSRDPLGLEPLYVQAKRYAADQSVGPAAIQAFYGALSMQAANSGVFFTTARFTQGALEAARQLPARIVLIDGEELARLMVCHGVGVRVVDRLEVPEVDEGYFE